MSNHEYKTLFDSSLNCMLINRARRTKDLIDFLIDPEWCNDSDRRQPYLILHDWYLCSIGKSAYFLSPCITRWSDGTIKTSNSDRVGATMTDIKNSRGTMIRPEDACEDRIEKVIAQSIKRIDLKTINNFTLYPLSQQIIIAAKSNSSGAYESSHYVFEEILIHEMYGGSSFYVDAEAFPKISSEAHAPILLGQS